jgi:non-ribosomal peptide synthetase component F
MNEMNAKTLRDGLDNAVAIDCDLTDSGPRRSIQYGPVKPSLLRNELLSEIFAASVAAHGLETCLIAGETRLTYLDVDGQARAIARGLIRKGVGPGDVVGLWMARGADLLIGQIAIAMTGAAWLPFDADAPIERIGVCLTDAEAKALLTGGDHFAKAHGEMPCPVFTAADLIDTADQSPVDARAAGATPDHAAYMIYTSGSTGVPKGIVISQRNICHFLRAAVDHYGFESSDVMFQGASVAFDLSMEEIWAPYLVGARCSWRRPNHGRGREASRRDGSGRRHRARHGADASRHDAARYVQPADHHSGRRSLPAVSR